MALYINKKTGDIVAIASTLSAASARVGVLIEQQPNPHSNLRCSTAVRLAQV